MKQTKLEKIKLSSSDKLNYISNISTMISAGIPILSVVGALQEEARGNVKRILGEIHADLLHGKPLHISFAKFPRVFDMVTVNMIRAAEQSGTLDIALKDLKEQIKKDIAFTRKLRSAMTYPVLVLIVFVLVLLLILIVVMPKIAMVFSQLKVDIPLPTKILIFSSNALTHYPVFVIAGLLIFISGLVVLYKMQRKRIIRWLSRLPLISRLVRYIDLLRFSKNLHLMLNAGIAITSALELAQDVVVKPEVAKAIQHAKQTILAGKTLSYSFKENRKIFPSTMIELTQAGEKTGSLDRSMLEISEYFDYKVTDTLAMLTALMEPVMLVIVAGLVGAMMVAIIGPIYGMIGQIGSR